MPDQEPAACRAHRALRSRSRKLSVHPRPDQQRPRRGVGDPDLALREHAARVDDDDVGADDGQDAAAADDVHAAVLRHLRD